VDGHALISLYPNSDVDIHDKDWQMHLTQTAMEDLYTIYNKRKKDFEGARGAINAILAK
jgi:hypothetical protein